MFRRFWFRKYKNVKKHYNTNEHHANGKADFHQTLRSANVFYSAFSDRSRSRSDVRTGPGGHLEVFHQFHNGWPFLLSEIGPSDRLFQGPSEY